MIKLSGKLNPAAAALAAALTLAAWPALAEVVVVVHPSSATSSMTAQQVTQIFLGSSNAFPDGSNAVPVETKAGALRDEFLAKVMDKSAGQVKAVWSRIVFSGKGQPPREFPDAAGVKAFVAANPGAIGYIDKASLDASVKSVLKAP